MSVADHFGPRWREAQWSLPMDYTARLTRQGFRVWMLIPPRRGDPEYQSWQRTRLSHARITFPGPGQYRHWTDGHGINDDDAIAMAYGRVMLKELRGS